VRPLVDKNGRLGARNEEQEYQGGNKAIFHQNSTAGTTPLYSIFGLFFAIAVV